MPLKIVLLKPQNSCRLKPYYWSTITAVKVFARNSSRKSFFPEDLGVISPFRLTKIILGDFLGPTVREGHKHRVTTPEKPRKIPRTPAEPRRDPAEPSERPRRTL